ncbi:MAG: hypothetical protein RLY71_453 [Pseudomonadota bacterium]|jgi:hypothetical protein
MSTTDRSPVITCVVQFSGGAYLATSRAQGRRTIASATAGADHAVRRLAHKLAALGAGPAAVTVHQVDQDEPRPGAAAAISGCGVWEIREVVAPPTLITTALAWQPPEHAMPDADERVLIWFASHDSPGEWECAWFDGQDWRVCESGGRVNGIVLYWARPLGPGEGQAKEASPCA